MGIPRVGVRTEVRVVAGQSSLGVCGVTLMLTAVTSLRVLGVSGGLVANSGRLGVVALAHLVGSGVHRKCVRVFLGRSRSTALEQTHELAALAIARGVIVGRARSEASLLASVAHQHNFDQNGEDEEDLTHQLATEQNFT